jgi:hypothetical protein
MSTLVAQTISNGTVSTSSANVIQGSAKAWVNFNGTGTVAIRAFYNISSVVRNSSCQYTVNFTNAMVDTSYATLCSMQSNNTSGVAFNSVMGLADTGTYTTSAVQVQGYPAGDVSGYSGQPVNDSAIVNVAVLR